MDNWHQNGTNVRHLSGEDFVGANGNVEVSLGASLETSFDYSNNRRRSLACGSCRTQANIVTNTVLVSVVLLLVVSLFGWQRIEPYVKHAYQYGPGVTQQSVNSSTNISSGGISTAHMGFHSTTVRDSQ